MPRPLKLASTIIAIAISATIGGSVAYGSSTADGPAARPVSYSSASSGATTKLVIEHVRRGCHVWSTGTRQSASIRLSLTRRPRLQIGLQPTSLHVSLEREARLRILNRDLVAHQLVQIGGPSLELRGHMMTGKSQLIRLRQPGVYHFTNKVVKMGSRASRAMTIRPDNVLHLAVSVR